MDHEWSEEEDVFFGLIEWVENDSNRFSFKFSKILFSEKAKGAFTLQEVRLFIAVTTAACSATSRARRAGIRETWMQDAFNSKHFVEIKFFIGQPRKPSPLLQKRPCRS